MKQYIFFIPQLRAYFSLLRSWTMAASGRYNGSCETLSKWVVTLYRLKFQCLSLILNLNIVMMPWVRMAEVLREKLLVLPVTGNILESSPHSFLMLVLVSWVRHFLMNNKNSIVFLTMTQIPSPDYSFLVAAGSQEPNHIELTTLGDQEVIGVEHLY